MGTLIELALFVAVAALFVWAAKKEVRGDWSRTEATVDAVAEEASEVVALSLVGFWELGAEVAKEGGKEYVLSHRLGQHAPTEHEARVAHVGYTFQKKGVEYMPFGKSDDMVKVHVIAQGVKVEWGARIRLKDLKAFVGGHELPIETFLGAGGNTPPTTHSSMSAPDWE